MEGYNAKVKQTANELAVEAAEALKLPCMGGSDARGSLDEVGRGATLLQAPRSPPRRSWSTEILKGEFWPVMAGELPRLTRPGEAQAGKGGGKRGGGGGGGGGRRRRR